MRQLIWPGNSIQKVIPHRKCIAVRKGDYGHFNTNKKILEWRITEALTKRNIYPLEVLQQQH